MQLPNSQLLDFPGGGLTANPDGLVKFAWQNGVELDLGTARLNEFDEASGLAGKLRRHGSEDGLSGQVELETILPFGSEFVCVRQFDVASGRVLATCDVAPRGPGRIRRAELEPLTLRGDWRSVAVDGAEIAAGTAWQSDRPFRRLIAVDPSGFRLEIGIGDDLWRWSPEGSQGEYTIAVEAGCVTVRRKVLDFGEIEETELAKRPYRFQWYAAWRDAAGAAAPCGTVYDWSDQAAEACLKAAPTQRLLRKAVRQSPQSLSCAWGADADCDDPSHLERPGRGPMPHRDLLERTRFHLWANRQLQRRGMDFRWCNPAPAGVLEEVLTVPAVPGVAVPE